MELPVDFWQLVQTVVRHASSRFNEERNQRKRLAELELQQTAPAKSA